ncbi:MAG: probable membrane protein STY4873 [uncultured Nocardioidaceae bacterium]|uniref:Probable membrane protein STY4873 n=1 Tax=uncultured Nocardioidaceae bacterium TaxID=253824 RepID=A0A6J4L7W4_9ACTN|nr:MAG: probable membrane protein STY4873 [uncultured Nocardioidaceae bacterium]
MSFVMAGSDPQLDAERRAALRRMRGVAVGLLVLAAVVYLLTLGEDDGFLGFVNAGAEASMVGAIADWFAVVALFKHPLGLPIPHTALIPKRKEMFGRGLEEFIGENFLQEGIIRERVLGARPAGKAGDWLSHEPNARRVVLEGADLLRIALQRVRDEDVAELVQALLVPRFLEEPVSPLAGSLLHEVVEDGAHHTVVDLLLEEAQRWLSGNEATFYDVVAERAPWWAPEALNERVISRLYAELLAWIDDIRTDPEHRTRLALDRLLRELADGLLHDPDTIDRMERFKERVLSHPQVSATFVSLWNALRRATVDALQESDGLLVKRAVAEVMAFGQRLQSDTGLRKRIDEQAASVSVFLVERYGHELTAVITQTIDRWDGEEASRRIELQVGKDLQFVRINGTLVGGLVGVIIHTVSVLST